MMATKEDFKNAVEGNIATKILAQQIPMIARVCHEVNRAYCNAMGDASQPSWEDAPEWQKASAINGVQFAAANPNATPEDMHISWMTAKIADGWVYGGVKDAVAKTHPCMLPYRELPRDQRIKDYLFRAVVKALI